MSATKSPFVEKFLGTVSAHDVEFDCYGSQDCDGMYVEQVALKGGAIDIFDIVSKSVIKDIEAALERDRMDDSDRIKFDFNFFKKPDVFYGI
jgi:hypothetical protein